MTHLRNSRQNAQAALEYMLLLTVVAVVVFIAFKAPNNENSVLNRAQEASEGYYNTVTEVIMGKNPQPINGVWCKPKPNGVCECACPAPAFGGAYCVNDATCRARTGAVLAYCGDQRCDSGSETGLAGHPKNPGDPLTTCWEDCAFVPDCSKCNTKIPSAVCGGPCPIYNCTANQICMTSDCPTACKPTAVPPSTGYVQVCTPNNALCGGNPIPPSCGDGTLQGPASTPPGTEECDDGNNVNGDGCSATCTTEVAYCGNGVKEGAEVCDGVDLGGQDCRNFGYLGRFQLQCKADCTGFDTSTCYDCAPDFWQVPGCGGWANSGRGQSGQTNTFDCPSNCVGPQLTNTCQSNGTWSGRGGGPCVAVTCPQMQAQGSLPVCPVNLDAPVGTTFSQPCPSPYCVGGPITAVCNVGGIWSNMTGQCTQVGCPSIHVDGDVPACAVDLNFVGVGSGPAPNGITVVSCPPGCVGDRGYDWIVGYCQGGGQGAYVAGWSGSWRCQRP